MGFPSYNRVVVGLFCSIALLITPMLQADPLSPKKQKMFNREFQMLVDRAEKARTEFLDQVAIIREDFEGDEETDKEREETEQFISEIEKLNGKFDKLVQEYIDATEGS